ncbi:MAG TPA: 50S ribosomal protein L18 [Bacteroidia bacterium]|nr:MAG: 50S ribosomal protein L18 [Bacteroidetes bacterium OLB10]MBE7509295.1 50S ribosomal protein L18 [Bacteroidia bacterium]MBX3106380.1 50S ribosomal protein L18 [Bacteroidota bacterium]MCE7954214.1 50S ribosomal protein L18 [Bacteroidetes bacterium CHB6]OQB64372.1 MAG: 50S ribosomal protein L18 [Bacteroidetes bacterium ADurb.Bin141]
MSKTKDSRRAKIRKRIRGSVKGTQEKPRLSVFRSNKQIYAQVIDDVAGHTIAAASSAEAGIAKGNKSEISASVGKMIAERVIAKGISAVTFDRGGYLYHGRVKALAEGAREGGLKF